MAAVNSSEKILGGRGSSMKGAAPPLALGPNRRCSSTKPSTAEPLDKVVWTAVLVGHGGALTVATASSWKRRDLREREAQRELEEGEKVRGPLGVTLA